MSYNKWTENNIINFINKTNKYSFIGFVSEPNGIKSMVKVKCEVDNEHGEFICSFSNLKNNEKRNSTCCSKCNTNKKSEKNKTPFDDVKKYIESRNYLLLSDNYENNKTKLKIKCLKCGHEFLMSFSNFKRQNCPKCAISKRVEKSRHSFDYVKNEFMKSNFEILTCNYINAHQKLEARCLIHNEYFFITYHEYQQHKKTCPLCGEQSRKDKLKHSYNYVKNFIESQGDRLLSEEYVNNEEKLLIQCKCGNIFKMTFGNYISGHRCFLCNISKGENAIKEILNNNNIKFISQYRNEKCKYKNTLSFDFYLPEYNIAIEYDGEQHYKPIEYFGGIDGFNNIKIRDKIKDDFCKNNNIKLIRIPYWKKNGIKTILENELKIKLNNKYE